MIYKSKRNKLIYSFFLSLCMWRCSVGLQEETLIGFMIYSFSWLLLKIIRKKKRNPQIYMLNEELSGIISEIAMIMSRKTKK